MNMNPRTTYDLLQWDEREDYGDWLQNHEADNEEINEEELQDGSASVDLDTSCRQNTTADR
jgi:hypothetical protein